MNRKLVFLGIAGCLQLPMPEAKATPEHPHKTVQFYAGMAASLDRLSGNRTEFLLSGASNQSLFFSNNQSLRSNGLAAKGLVGFLWSIPKTSFVLSPEFYLGQGNTEKTLQSTLEDPAVPADKSLQSTLKRGLTLGIALRAGFYLTNCQNNLLYILIGVDRNKFENQYAFSSTDVLNAPVPTLFEKRSKWLRSPLIGIGFERKFGSFKMGIDLRYAPYSSWRGYTKKAAVSDDVIDIAFKPKVISAALTFCYLF